MRVEIGSVEEVEDTVFSRDDAKYTPHGKPFLPVSHRLEFLDESLPAGARTIKGKNGREFNETSRATAEGGRLRPERGGPGG
jgi:hypothetical protein